MEIDPLDLFGRWFAEAAAQEPSDPNAMTLATVDAAGNPDARIVLMKEFGPAGFVFYTNTESAKGRQLASDPRAALLFHWKGLARQVRIRGPVAPVEAAEASAYFATRVRPSRLGAWASAQSRPLAGRPALEAAMAEAEARFPAEVPRPPHWSGYRLAPLAIEFWQEGAYRLHDRVLYVRARAAADAPWTARLLNP